MQVDPSIFAPYSRPYSIRDSILGENGHALHGRPIAVAESEFSFLVVKQLI
jgi:hypothetical protein